MDSDGDGDGSSSSDDVSSTAAADEGPRGDPELTPPANAYFTEEEDALHRLSIRTRRRRRRRMTTRRRVQLDQEEEGAIACLPETAAAGEADECAVCLEELEAGGGDAVRTMPCAHGFHESCIAEWLRASRLCPLCRFALPPEAEDTTTATGDEDAETETEAGHHHDADDGETEAGHDNNGNGELQGL